MTLSSPGSGPTRKCASRRSEEEKHVVAGYRRCVNDAPALKWRIIGIAMGVKRNRCGQAAADMICWTIIFASIIAAIEEGRAVYEISASFLLTFSPPISLKPSPIWLMPCSKSAALDHHFRFWRSIWERTCWPALGLASAKPEPGNMAKPPRSRKERLLDWRLLVHVYLFLGILEAIVGHGGIFLRASQRRLAMGREFGKSWPLISSSHHGLPQRHHRHARLWTCFFAKRRGAAWFSAQLFDNHIILWGIALEIALILAIDYTDWGHLIFGYNADCSWKFGCLFCLRHRDCCCWRRLRKFVSPGWSTNRKLLNLVSECPATLKTENTRITVKPVKVKKLLWICVDKEASKKIICVSVRRL